MPTPSQDLATLASTFHAAGYAPVPVTIDKAPRHPGIDPYNPPDNPASYVRWKSYQSEPAPPEQLARWFTHPEARGLGLVLSPQLPGRLACLDFDDAAAYLELDRFMRESDDELAAAWRKLHGWKERTPSGGVHLLFTIEDPPAIPKLEKIDTLGIGKASHCVMAPTPGYSLVSPARDPQRLTLAELELITSTIRAQQGTAAAAPPPPRVSGNGAGDARYPSDDYNAKADHGELLRGYGWRYLFHRAGVEYWRRPGKETGVSGTWGYEGQRLFHCFTTSVPELEGGRSYSPFALLAAMEHGGDYRAATLALRDAGYGAPLTGTLKGAKITEHGEIIRPGDPGYDDARNVSEAPEWPEDDPEASDHAETASEPPTGPQAATEGATGPTGDTGAEEPADDATGAEEASRVMLRPAADPLELDPVMQDIAERLAHYQETGSAIRGHRTGIDPLDDKLGGLEAGRVTILQAQPGAGKTTFSNQVAHTLASAGVPVVYVSFENEPADLMRKQLARLADVSPGRLDRGTLPESGYDAIDAAAERFAEEAATLYYLNGTAETTIETIRGALYYVRNQHPAGGHPVVMIDYLQQLARIAGGGPRDDMMTRVGLISRGLTDLAKDEALRCHVWAISSMGREAYKNSNGKAPGMAAGKYSGDLEFDASAVLSLTKGEPSQARDSNHAALLLSIVKNRYGQDGTIELEQSLRSLAITPRDTSGPRMVHPNGSAADRVRAGWN